MQSPNYIFFWGLLKSTPMNTDPIVDLEPDGSPRSRVWKLMEVLVLQTYLNPKPLNPHTLKPKP